MTTFLCGTSLIFISKLTKLNDYVVISMWSLYLCFTLNHHKWKTQYLLYIFSELNETPYIVHDVSFRVPVWTIPCNYESLFDKRDEKSPSFAHVRVAPRRLSERVDASSYKSSFRSAPIDFLFFLLLLLLLLFWFSSHDSKIAGTGFVVPLPFPCEEWTHSTRSSRNESSLPSLLYTFKPQHAAGIVASVCDARAG